MNRLRKLLNIKSGEGRPVLILFAYFFFLVAVTIAGKTARDTYFLSRFDKSYLSLMFLAVALATAITVAIYTRLSRQIPLIPVTIATAAFFALTMFLFQFRLRGWAIPMLYVWVEVLTTVMFSQFWILAGAAFNPRQAKRLFGLIGTGSPIAGILVGTAIQPFVRRFGSSHLLTLTALFIVLCGVMAWFAGRYVFQSTAVSAESPTEATAQKRTWDGYLKAIAIAIGVGAMATAIIDYQFKIISSNAFDSEASLAAFFGFFYAVTSILALFVQFFLTGRLLIRFGVLAGLLVLPMGLSIGSMAILLSPALISAVIARTSDQVTKFSINDASVQLLWVPIAPDRKKVIKPVVEGTIKNSLQGIAGVAMFVFLKFFELQYLSLVALGLIVLWVVNAFYLKTRYVQTLMAAIERRQLNFGELQLDTTDSDSIATIDTALNSGEESRQVFALELLDELSLQPWRETLRRLFKDGSFLVRQKILAMTAESPGIISNLDVLGVIHAQDALANHAIIVAGERRMTEVLPALAACLENRETHPPETVAAAAAAVLLMGQGPVTLAREILEDMLSRPDKQANITAMKTLANAPTLLSEENLNRFLHDDSPQVCYAALEIAEKRNGAALIHGIASTLRFFQTAALARRVLRTYPAEEVFPVLTSFCEHRDTERQCTIEIIRTLKNYPTLNTIYYLVNFLDFSDPSLYDETVDALLAIARKRALPPEILNLAKREIATLARRIYASYGVLQLIDAKPDATLLNWLIVDDIERSTAIVLKLSVLHRPETPIEQYIYYVQAGDTQRLANVLEILDNIIPGRVRELVTSLVEPLSVRERVMAGVAYFHHLYGGLSDTLVNLIQSKSEWRVVVGLDYVLRHRNFELLRRVDWERLGAYPSVRELFTHDLDGDDYIQVPSRFPVERFLERKETVSMFSTLEKTIILKGVSLFQDIPAEEIFYVAQVVEEERFPAGTTFIKEGDVGDSLYIIVSGAVRVHRAGRELNVLKKGAALGEIALLDRGPRSASCTTLEETVLLKVGQNNFYDVMVSRVEFMRGVMQALSEQIRRLTNLYTQDTNDTASDERL